VSETNATGVNSSFRRPDVRLTSNIGYTAVVAPTFVTEDANGWPKHSSGGRLFLALYWQSR